MIDSLLNIIANTITFVLGLGIIVIPFCVMYWYSVSDKKQSTPPDVKDIDVSDDDKLSDNRNITDEDDYPYQKVFLLTKNEWSFYKSLKPITDKYRLHILSKVRMADIIQVKPGLGTKKFYSAFGRIKSRHIDFVIADPRNLRILMAIELDDSSHNNIDRQQSDYFEDKVFETVGLPFIRTKGINGVEEQICDKLKISIKK